MRSDLFRVPYEKVTHPVDDLLLGSQLGIAERPEGDVRLINHHEMSFVARLMLCRLLLDPLLSLPDLHTTDRSCGDSAYGSSAAGKDESDRDGATRHALPAFAAESLLSRPLAPHSDPSRTT